MPMILQLTDGTTTCNLVWHSAGNRKYMLARDSWAPKIARLRKSTLGGSGPYMDEVESFQVHVMGETESEVLTNLYNLVSLLDQAERFWRLGQNVSPVVMQWAPEGATRVYNCLVLGRAPGDETNAAASLPVSLNRDVRMLMIEAVNVAFLRRGLLLDPTTESTTSSTSANPTVLSATLTTSIPTSSPTKIQMAWSAALLSNTNATILYASATSRLQLYEAESGSLGATVTSTADAAAKARGGNVARWAPADTTLLPLIDTTLSGFDSTSRRVGVWIAVRPNTAATTFQLQCSLESQTTPLLTVDGSSLTPRIMFLGVTTSNFAPSNLRISGKASAGSGTCDIDYITILALDDERSGSIIATGNGTSPLVIDPRPLTGASPQATLNAGNLAASYLGDGMIHTNGQTIAALMLQTNSTYWRAVDAGTNVVNNTLTVTRWNGYLVPR